MTTNERRSVISSVPAQRRTLGRFSLALLAVAGLPAVALGGPGRMVRVTTYAEFAEGLDQGVLLTSQGDVRGGWSSSRLTLPQATDDSMRAMVAGPDGSVWIGTGGETPSILLYQKGQLRKLATLPTGTWVTALCLLDGQPGHVLAATAQDGRLFDVGPDGKVQLWAQVEAEHVWALSRDAGVTYVATGPGRLWAIDDKDAGAGRAEQSKSKARKLLETAAKHFLSLTRGEDGALYVGTSDDAVLYRVEPGRDGKPATARAIHDFNGNEVRAVVARGGVLYVAVNDMQRGDTGLRGVKLSMPAAGSAPGVKAAAVGTPLPPTTPIEKKGKGALFRIDEAGRVEQLHAITDGFYNALHLDAAGSVYAAASAPGGRGRVFRIQPDRTVATLLELKESDVLSLSLGVGSDRLLGTGNSAAVYKLSDETAQGAYYQSKAFDGQSLSQWGTLRFLGDGLRVETRTGNVAKADGTWSAWQSLASPGKQAVTGEQTGKIVSPPGRYLQARFYLSGTSVLRDFTVSYQPVNQRHRVLELQLGEDANGRVARGVKPTSLLVPRSALVKLKWKVENPDEDELSYRLYVRPAAAGSSGGVSAGSGKLVPEGDGWLKISGPEALTKTELEWNTDTVGDGTYELQLIASDEKSNPPEQLLTYVYTSPPFVVDNRRPELRDVKWNAERGAITGVAVDAATPIAELAYSIDGGEFYPVAAKDGLLDDLSEEFAVKPLRLTAGTHTAVVRALDAADNASTTQLVITVK